MPYIISGFLRQNPNIKTLKGILYTPYNAGNMPN
ncbi:uncharacterized protein FFC1_13874 [Fusarium fujikuroi]|nr:uncharacterized protein FFC1_13874 [Fusarium fujikuroi]